MADGEPAIDRARDRVGAEDLLDERRHRPQRAEDDRDVAGGVAVAQQRGDLCPDQLDLGALATRAEQPNGAAGFDRLDSTASNSRRSSRCRAAREAGA